MEAGLQAGEASRPSRARGDGGAGITAVLLREDRRPSVAGLLAGLGGELEPVARQEAAVLFRARR